MIHLLKEYFMPGLMKSASFRTIKSVAGLMKIDFGGCLISSIIADFRFSCFCRRMLGRYVDLMEVWIRSY